MTNTQPSNAKRGDQNLQATGFMLVAVSLSSLVPVFMTWGEGHQAPFMFNAVRVLFMCLGLCICLIVSYRRQLFDRVIWNIICQNWRRWSLLGALLGTFPHAVFGWSLKYIDVSVAAVLFQTWPLWMIFMTGKMFQNDSRYENVVLLGWFCILMGFAGLGFVILSQTGDVALIGENMPLSYLILGVSLALASAIISALGSSCTIRWGTTVLKDIPDYKKQETDKNLTIFFVLMSIILAGIPGIIIGIALSVGGGHNEILDVDNMTTAAFLGFFVLVPARIFSREANLITTKLEINALAYGTPIFTLAWLTLLEYINVPKIDWLVIGAIGVAAANALLNFKAEQRTAYQSLVIALWGCGVIVYFRPVLHVPVFYEAMTVVATMFVLILSFRINRLVERTSTEDRITTDIWHKISSLSSDLRDKLREIDEAGSPEKLSQSYDDFVNSLKKETDKISADGEKLFTDISSDLRDKLRKIDEAGSPEKLSQSYDDFVNSLKKETDKISTDGEKLFTEIMRQVDNLAHSKQQGSNFGEQAVLWILGGISSIGLLFFMPEYGEWIFGMDIFFLEMVAFLGATTIIFLLFHIQDLQRDRKRRIFRTKSDTESKGADKDKLEGIKFRETHNRKGEKTISAIFCVGIVVTFAVLFWLK